MPDRIIHRGALRTAVLKILIYGILIGAVLETTALLLLINVQWDFVYWLYRFFHWPTGLFSGMIVSSAAVFLSRVTVVVEEGRILIRSIGRRKCFDLSQFVDSSIARKTHIGSYSKYTTVKSYLIFETPDGIRRCRLYGFGEKELEEVLGTIRAAQAAYLTDEEKTAIVEEYRDEISEALIEGREGSNEFLLPSSVLAGKEKRYLKKVSLISIGIVIVVGALDAYELLARHTFGLQMLFLTMLALALPIIVSAMYAGLGRRRHICAERVVIDGEHLQVGRQYYTYSYVDKIRLTSPRKRSSSIFPVQRYMHVLSEGKLKKYWLGSEISFASYENLCRSLESGMVMHQDKLTYM